MIVVPFPIKQAGAGEIVKLSSKAVRSCQPKHLRFAHECAHFLTVRSIRVRWGTDGERELLPGCQDVGVPASVLCSRGRHRDDAIAFDWPLLRAGDVVEMLVEVHVIMFQAVQAYLLAEPA